MTAEALLAYAHLLSILTMVVFLGSEAALCRKEWMNAAVVEILKNPATKEKLSGAGITPSWSTPEAFEKMVKAEVEKAAKSFPAGLKYAYANDTTDFIKLSITEVVKTLAEAMGLVFLIMLLFLQNIRYTLIPAIVAEGVPGVAVAPHGVLDMPRGLRQGKIGAGGQHLVRLPA